MIKVGIAGTGAIGSTVGKALLANTINNYALHAISDVKNSEPWPVPNLNFTDMAEQCDVIIEALPPHIVPELCKAVQAQGKDLILISSCALLMYPDILENHKCSRGRIIVPSGALIGLDGVNALKQMGIKAARISSIKPPMGFANAPFIMKNKIDLMDIKEKTRLFAGNAYEAAEGFPANVNVAATLSLAGIGPEMTHVEVWADPHTTFNSHEIEVESEFSRISAKVQNKPDPANPKTSVLAAQSIIATLRGFTEPFMVL